MQTSQEKSVKKKSTSTICSIAHCD